MKNIPDVKLAIVVGSTDWLPSDIAIEIRRKIVETYAEEFGNEAIYECQICIDDNEINVKRAMKEISKAECNAVCLCYANYGPESAGTLFAEEFDGPVMMFAVADEGNVPFMRERRDAISGFINACYALKLRGTNVYIPNHPQGTVKECVQMIHDYLPIARTILGIRELKIVSIGPRPSSYLASCAPNYLLYDLGVEVSEYSELEIFDSYKKHDNDRRISDVVTQMQQELGSDADMLLKYAQYELTLDDWVRAHKGNRKYVAMTSTCWPAFPGSFNFVPCYVNSRMTGKGIPIACEVDVYGAFSEYLAQCITDEIVTILNINNNVPFSIYENEIEGKKFDGRVYESTDLFIGYHCGVTSSQLLIKPSLKNHFVNEQLIGADNAKGTLQGRLKAGKVTLLRIQGCRDGKIRAYVAQGQILPISADTYGGYGIIAVPQMERFIKNVIIEKQFPNHTTLMIGHHAEKIIEVLKLLGISEIDYNHPIDYPYENENIFHTLNNWY